MRTVSELLNQLDRLAPFTESEPWDNVGLLVGNHEDVVNGILTTLDCSVETVDEAIVKGANVIVSHHPLIFPKTMNIINDGAGKVIRKLIKNDINLITMHTNLDHQPDGVSHMIAKKLGYDQTTILLPNKGTYKKLRININVEDKDSFKQNLLENAPVGNLGDYTYTSFEYPVHGQFKPQSGANPHIGESGKLEYVDEYIMECIFQAKDEYEVITALKKYHPYEEPAYDVYTLDNKSNKGLGVSFTYGDTLENLVQLVEHKTGLKVVNTVKGNDKLINTVGIIGGSGMSYAGDAFKANIDVLITGDVKYHEAYDAKASGQNIIDAGHYLEVIMAEGLAELITDNIDEKVIVSNISTNPFE